MDAELLIMPELDRAALVAVKKQIDLAMKQSAKRAGLEFQNEISKGIMKGVAIGNAGAGVAGGNAPSIPGAPRPPNAPPPRAPGAPQRAPRWQDEIHGPMVGAPLTPSQLRAQLRAEQREMAREAQRAERIAEIRANRFTVGGVGKRLKGAIKGMNIFKLGGAALALAPFAITGGAGLWGMMRAGTIRDNVNTAIEQWIESSTAQDRVNLANMTGIDLGSIIGLERLGRDAGMKQGELASIAGGIIQGIATKSPFFAKYHGMNFEKAIPTALASLANVSETERSQALAEMGVLNPGTVEFFRRLKQRGGKTGEVTLEDVLKQQEEDAQAAKNAQDEAKRLEVARAEVAKATEKNTADLARAFGEHGTVAAYIEDIARQQKQLITDLGNYGNASNIANTLTEAMQQLDDEALAAANQVMPLLLSVLQTIEPLITQSGEIVDLLTKPINQLTLDDLKQAFPDILGPFVDQWREFEAAKQANGNAMPPQLSKGEAKTGYAPSYGPTY